MTPRLLARLLMAISVVVLQVYPSEGAMDLSSRSVNLVSLQDSLEPLEQHFNAHRDTRRFFALLSPT